MNYTKIAKIFAKTLIQEIKSCFFSRHSEPFSSCHSEVATEESRGTTTKLFRRILHSAVAPFRMTMRGFAQDDSVFVRARNFVKYHNAFTIMLVVTIVGAGTVMASEPVKEMLAEVVGEEVVVETGIDNATLLDANLDEFDFEMTIDAVSEDENNYYIEYSFNTLGIMDNVWQELFREEVMKVSKLGLGKNIDLGLYLTEELGEIADCELVFLRQMQEKETEKGETQIVETTEYSGLIGLVLDVKNKVLPDYEPVVQPARNASHSDADGPEIIVVAEQHLATVVESPPTPEPSDTFEPILGCTDETATNYNPEATQNNETCEYPLIAVLGCMDSTATNYNSDATEDEGTCEYPLPDPPTDEPPLSDTICDADHIDLCNTQQLCEEISLFWYTDICNSEPEILADVCDINHITLCVTQELCETAGLHWYGNEEEEVCNLEPASEPELICDVDHIDLCNTQQLCEAISLFWYDETCNLEPEPQPEPILGCTDSTATNYSAEATEDDSSCQYPPAEPPVCESFTYSDYTECSSDGTQTRTILTSSPDGCIDGSPTLSQPCEYPPPDELPTEDPDPTPDE